MCLLFCTIKLTDSSSNTAITLDTGFYVLVKLVAQTKSLKDEFGAITYEKIVQIKNNSCVV